MEHNHVDTRKN